MWFVLENSEEQSIVESDKYPEMRPNWSSCSPGYDSKEALWKGQHILDKPCVICGRYICSNYTNRESLVRKNMCFGCDLWDSRVLECMHNTKIMIVNGIMYSIGPENQDPNKFRGFGGHRFVFIRDGFETISTNVWCGGNVPKIWLDKIPDNAITKKSK